MNFIAKLLQDNGIVAKQIDGELEISPTGRCVGHFDLPANYHLRGGIYRLELSDGRSADIILRESASETLLDARVAFSSLDPISQSNRRDAGMTMPYVPTESPA